MSTTRVEILIETEVRVSPVAKKTYPKGWVGAVDAEIAAEMVEQGLASVIGATAAEPAPAAPVVTPTPADVSDTDLQVIPTADELASMKAVELREMAEGLGIAGAGSMKKAELVAAIVAVTEGAPVDGA